MEQAATARRAYNNNSNFNNYHPITCLPTDQGEGNCYHHKSRNVQYMGALSEMTGPPVEVRYSTIAREKAYRESLRRDIEEREIRREEKRRAEEAEENREFGELTGQWKRRNETETRSKVDNNERTMDYHQRSSNGLAMHSSNHDAAAAVQWENNNNTVNMAIPMDNEMTGNVKNCDKESGGSAFIQSSSYPAGYPAGLQDVTSSSSVLPPSSTQQPTISIPLEDFEALNKLCHELLLEQKILREEVKQFKLQLELPNEKKNKEPNAGGGTIINTNQLGKSRYTTKTKKASNLCEKGGGNRHRPSVGFGSSTQRQLGL